MNDVNYLLLRISHCFPAKLGGHHHITLNDEGNTVLTLVLAQNREQIFLSFVFGADDMYKDVYELTDELIQRVNERILKEGIVK